MAKEEDGNKERACIAGKEEGIEEKGKIAKGKGWREKQTTKDRRFIKKRGEGRKKGKCSKINKSSRKRALCALMTRERKESGSIRATRVCRRVAMDADKTKCGGGKLRSQDHPHYYLILEDSVDNSEKGVGGGCGS
mmetsp:Transcript_42008/g.84883  ORF Transcript_42008/g.84883 Transcript_42008/m.84883 type:complete len:136 (+) Transcript_42008:165-572(+)